MDIEEYIANVPEHRRERFEAIHQLIHSLYPEAKVSMKYKMPTYESEGGWVALANQKSYISVYTCSLEHISGFKIRHPQIKTGKGCINFRDKDMFPLTELRPVIRSAMESGPA